jgi:hypothetical protein
MFSSSTSKVSALEWLKQPERTMELRKRIEKGRREYIP